MNIIFKIIALLGFTSLHLYLFIRGWQALPKNSIIYTLYSVIFISTLVFFLCGVFIAEKLPESPKNIFKLIERYWFVFFSYLLLAAFLGDLLRILNVFLNLFPDCITNNYSKVKLVYLFSVLFFWLLISLLGFFQMENPQIVDLNLRVNKTINESEDLCIVAVSDLHIGCFTGGKKLARWIEKINNLEPDVILLVGDIFDINFDTTKSRIIDQEFKKINARFGVFAVLGNNEYYSNVKLAIQNFEYSGIKVLRDQSVVINNRFAIIGRDDATNPDRKTVKRLLTGLDLNMPTILLDHQPHITEAVKNRIDLQISGHLHNGQIFPNNFIISKKWELSYGYRKIDNTNFYVSSGLGVSFVPIRIGTQTQIVRIHLKVINHDQGI
jgi:uncharacterized protein